MTEFYRVNVANKGNKIYFHILFHFKYWNIYNNLNYNNF